MNQVSVKLKANQSNNYVDFDFEDLNTTKEEWALLSEDEKLEKVQLIVHDLNEQPYWMVDKITTR